VRLLSSPQGHAAGFHLLVIRFAHAPAFHGHILEDVKADVHRTLVLSSGVHWYQMLATC